MAGRPQGDSSSAERRHEVAAVPASVPSIRHELDRVLEALLITNARAADIRLAVTEACTNVVLHAYPDSTPGDMVITFHTTPETFTISVADSGVGIDACPQQPGFGVGFGVIEALADAVTVTSLGPGTSIQMTFRR